MKFEFKCEPNAGSDFIFSKVVCVLLCVHFILAIIQTFGQEYWSYTIQMKYFTNNLDIITELHLHFSFFMPHSKAFLS